jgi:hypothetical protein
MQIMGLNNLTNVFVLINGLDYFLYYFASLLSTLGVLIAEWHL